MQDRWRKPFLASFPLVPVAKGAVTDSVLRRYVHSTTRSERNRSLEGTNARVPRILTTDSTLNADSLAFLEDVLAHPHDGVKQRYHRLCWSTRRGTQVKQQLIEDGWLESLLVPEGRTRKVILRLSSNARRQLGFNDKRPRESLAHEYWKRYYADRYRAKGYHVQVEAPLGGGRVDVLARKGAERVGIEVETGKSDAVSNVKRCLLAQLDRIVVVATDGAASSKVEQQLGKAGLMVPARVTLILRDQHVGIPLDSQVRP